MDLVVEWYRNRASTILFSIKTVSCASKTGSCRYQANCSTWEWGIDVSNPSSPVPPHRVRRASTPCITNGGGIKILTNSTSWKFTEASIPLFKVSAAFGTCNATSERSSWIWIVAYHLNCSNSRCVCNRSFFLISRSQCLPTVMYRYNLIVSGRWWGFRRDLLNATNHRLSWTQCDGTPRNTSCIRSSPLRVA